MPQARSSGLRRDGDHWLGDDRSPDMLVIPATAPLHRLCRITLTCSDRDDIPARVTATCARRCGVVVALAYARGRPGDMAELELSVEVDERHRTLLVHRLAGLVDVHDVRCRDL